MCVPYNANAFEFDWTEINKFYFGYKPGYLYARIHAVGGIGSTIKSDKYTHFLQFDTILSPITQPLKCSTGNQAIKKINATYKGAPPPIHQRDDCASSHARTARSKAEFSCQACVYWKEAVSRFQIIRHLSLSLTRTRAPHPLAPFIGHVLQF